ncbi:PREDICTED: calmodulin-like [Acropora digitifera]|uniref:calmodulin-like n=1 Tax=Acropora digitifera TaxID=70779 RepID=UPI00077B1A13|nr:PREDICTED: calmodulin-like [Acropora digitifera]
MMKNSLILLFVTTILIVSFVESMPMWRRSDEEDEAASNFSTADEDKDGLVSLEELKKYMKDSDGSGNQGDMAAKLRFGSLDSNGDDVLDFEEFKEF